MNEYDDSTTTRVARVLRLAIDNKVAGPIIGGARSDVYERQAADLLQSSEARAKGLGLTASEQEEQVAMYLQLLACEATLRSRSRKRKR